jgi:hypothetical protein
MNENIQRFSTVRRNRGIGGPGSANVACGIRSGFSLAINEIEFFMGISGEDEIVMRKVIIAPVESKVEDDTGAGGLGISAIEFSGKVTA